MRMGIVERLPLSRRDSEKRLTWLREAIEEQEASLRAALKLVLRERHGRLSRDEASATMRATAWCHLLAGRSQLRALRELAKEAHAEIQRTRPQLTLF